MKEESRLLLFVIDDATRALVSVLEAVEHICRGKYCVIVMTDLQGSKDFDGKGVTASEGEMKDLYVSCLNTEIRHPYMSAIKVLLD